MESAVRTQGDVCKGLSLTLGSTSLDLPHDFSVSANAIDVPVHLIVGGIVLGKHVVQNDEVATW